MKQQRPSQLVRLLPNENATDINPEELVQVILQAQPRQPPIDFSLLQLLIDGEDVTSQARINPTYDRGNNSALVVFGSSVPFSVGKHTAEIRFAEQKKQLLAYHWDFSVSPASPTQIRSAKAKKYLALFAKTPGVNSSPNEVAQYALNYTYARAKVVNGTSQVVLARRVIAEELPKLEFEEFPTIDKDRPLMLVILKGDFEVKAILPVDV